MPCDTKLRRGQTISQRKQEIKDVVAKLERKLSSGEAKLKLSPKGAIAFVGLSDAERSGVTDACAYRRIMSGNNAIAKAALARAEALAGVRVSSAQLALGAHGHADSNGNISWHDHKG